MISIRGGRDFSEYLSILETCRSKSKLKTWEEMSQVCEKSEV